ncbi:hypothetical protein CY34DRAFT_707697 [Suillus luteus UH-Slu-Lm8-n1]|uniref:Uncharacterized protein n=1 Tax=Suillus luteus UH-Slu-Lm8-n1 TaxID=930992 RepID=A0A0D0A0V7_9AGAM|nr:hypothetical protein CY34DRAFT_707697 [Suillus luteus UH-Slu-Lm8-n1]
MLKLLHTTKTLLIHQPSANVDGPLKQLNSRMLEITSRYPGNRPALAYMTRMAFGTIQQGSGQPPNAPLVGRRLIGEVA